MDSQLEDDKIISALKQTFQHISIQQQKYNSLDLELAQTKERLQIERDEHFKQCHALQTELQRVQSLYQQQPKRCMQLRRYQQQCTQLRRNIVDMVDIVHLQKKQIAIEFTNFLYEFKQCQKMCQNRKYGSVQNKLMNVKSALQSLQCDIGHELHNFECDFSNIQKAMLKQEITLERHQSAAAHNMEHQLHTYLRQKDELQQKINDLEAHLSDKHDTELVTQMKRFRSAAIITSVTALPDDGGQGISYHELSEHERHAIQLKGKLERKIYSERNKVNITRDKVDEFIRSGGLRRFPVMESEFVYAANCNEQQNDIRNRFRFGTKYINIEYQVKQNELFVVKENGTILASPTILQDWIQKNAAIEMRKKLLKVSQKKKQKKTAAGRGV